MWHPTSILGVDEAGTGCSAGPFVVGAFYAPTEDWAVERLDDSKEVSKKEREKLFDLLMKKWPERCATLFVTADEINRRSLGVCHREAMAKVAEILLERLGPPNRVIFDGNMSYLSGGEGIVDGDALFQAVSAASILAKVTRDRFMRTEVHAKYPQYNFAKHKGYWTPEHKQAVLSHGLCVEHRVGYRNIQELIETKVVAFPRFSR